MHKRKTEAAADAEYWTVQDFLRKYPIGQTKAYELINTGAIPSILIGRRRLIEAQGARTALQAAA
jgi:hypothetical protein